MGRKLNSAEIKKQLDEVNSGGGGGTDYWKPVEGSKSAIRLVCPEDGNPFRRFFFHYKIGKAGSFLCPKKNFGEACAVCDLVAELFRGSEEDREVAKDIMAKERTFSPVVDRADAQPKIKIWGYGKNARKDLLNFADNPEYGDALVDEEAGLDLDIDYDRPHPKAYPVTTISPRRKETSLLSDVSAEDLEAFLATVPDIDDIMLKQRRTSEQVEEFLAEHLNVEDGEGGGETAKFGGKDEPSNVGEAFAAIEG